MYPSSYHNTTSAPPNKTKARAVKCGKQEMYILQLFKGAALKVTGWTACELTGLIVINLWHKEFMHLDDIDRIWRGIAVHTSVKRSLTNLVNAGYLVKSKDKRDGKMGKENLVYYLKSE